MSEVSIPVVPTGPEVWRRHAAEHVVEQSIDESSGPG